MGVSNPVDLYGNCTKVLIFESFCLNLNLNLNRKPQTGPPSSALLGALAAVCGDRSKRMHLKHLRDNPQVHEMREHILGT
jgi:hypothetical protein